MGAVCRTRPIWCRGHLHPDSEAQLCALSFVWFVPPHPSTLPPSTLLPCASRTSPAPQGNSAASAGETRRHDYEDETASPWRHDYVGETASLLAAAMGAVPTWEVRVKVKVNYYENQSVRRCATTFSHCHIATMASWARGFDCCSFRDVPTSNDASRRYGGTRVCLIFSRESAWAPRQLTALQACPANPRVHAPRSACTGNPRKHSREAEPAPRW